MPRSGGEEEPAGTSGDEEPVASGGSEQELFVTEEPSQNTVTEVFSSLMGAPLMSSGSVITSRFGACYNMSDDIFLYGKSVDERVYPSGATKLLTALTVYEALGLDFVFKVGDEVDMVQKDAGVAGLKEGQMLNLEAILTALLIPIGNDAAYTISVNTARWLSETGNAGNREMNDYFVRMMNDYAQKIGCQNSNFSNPDGYHANNNYSTVRDLTIISAHTAKNPIISLICGKKEHEVTFNSGDVASWTNSNPFLELENWNIRGLRTGYTDESGFSAQILTNINGKDFIITVAGADTAAQRELDVMRLLELARDGYTEDIISVY